MSFPAFDEVKELILLAKREDLRDDDVTSRLMVPADAVRVGTLIQKSVGVACGLPMVEMICGAYDERLRVEMIPGFHMELIEGRFSDASSTPLLRLRGPMRSLLSAERVILNFLQHLSGVATQTQRYVKRVEGTGAKIFDTRKTMPGFRALDKYAVRAGGGHNHRAGLFDAVLIKDNHLANVGTKDLAAFLSDVVARSRAEDAQRTIEVEVTSLEQLREVLKVDGVDVVMLDNMDCPRMETAVDLRNKSHSTSSGQAHSTSPGQAGRKGKLALEASGGVTLETVRSIALVGVDRISVGAITHSAPAMDISLEIET